MRVLTHVTLTKKSDSYHAAMGFTYVVRSDQGIFEVDDDTIMGSTINKEKLAKLYEIPQSLDEVGIERNPAWTKAYNSLLSLPLTFKIEHEGRNITDIMPL